MLVAISIPIFTSQLEKAREATDLANICAAYAEVQTSALTDAKKNEGKVTYENGKYSETVTLKQQKEGWQSTVDELAGISVSSVTTKSTKGGTCTVATTIAANGDPTVSISFAPAS